MGKLLKTKVLVFLLTIVVFSTMVFYYFHDQKPIELAQAQTPQCGNNITEPGEACDGSDINGYTCSSVAAGFTSGTLSCKSDCSSYNVSQCIQGNTINALSCEQVDVQAAIDSAVDGDTVIIPSCFATNINSQINIDKSISIIGAGIDKTILVDGTESASLFSAVIPDGKPIRFSKMTLISKSGINTKGTLKIMGGTKNFRVDHIKFDMTGCSGGRMTNFGSYTDPSSTFGVIDNNIFTSTGKIGCNGVSEFGNEDLEWNIPWVPGRADAVYMEDNIFNMSSVGDGAFDMYSGSRYVFRYNTIDGTNIGHHGHDSSHRSTLGYEVYNNIFNNTKSTLSRLWNSRGGTGLFWGNIVRGGYSSFISYQSYRSCPSSGNGGVEGNAKNTDNSPNILIDSTITFGSPIPIPLDRDYAIYNLDDQSECVLSSYTTTTATCDSGLIGGIRNYWQNGDRYLIGRDYFDNYCVGYPPLSSSADGNTPGQEGYPCIDQIGRSPSPDGSGNQILTPSYAWSNDYKGDNYSSSVVSTWGNCPRATTYHIVSDRDYYDQKSIDSHLNVGLYEDIPSGCIVNDGYFAIDQGSQGILYKCTSTNKWEEYYQPYIYPHPLVQIEADLLQPQDCPPLDLDCSGDINIDDLTELKSLWGQAGIADLNQDGVTNTPDLGIMMKEWSTN